MKFLCDVHLPIKPCKFLVGEGHEAIHVNQILKGSLTPDGDISYYADQRDCIVITEDADFRISYFLRKTPRKLVRICLGNLPNHELLLLINSQLSALEELNKTGGFYLEISRDSVAIFN